MNCKRAAAIILMGIAAGTARAAEPPDPQVAAIEAQTALIIARTNLQTAETGLAQARMSALGLTTDATGKTELKEKGGELEGWMLSAKSIAAAAASIKALLPAGAKTRPIVLLAAHEAFDLTLPHSVEARLTGVQARLTAAIRAAGCQTPGGRQVGIASVGAVLPVLGGLINAFKTDTEISGVDGPTDSRLLVNALATQAPLTGTARWIVPGDVAMVPASSSIGKLWQSIGQSRINAAACRAGLGAAPAGTAAKAAAVLGAALEDAETSEKEVVGTGDGRGRLIEAIRVAQIAASAPWIMRVYVEHGGGSLIVRKNLWTALGAPAVGVTGGSVVSWRLVDPLAGAIEGGGLLFCRSALTSLRAVHDGRSGSAYCSADASDGDLS